MFVSNKDWVVPMKGRCPIFCPYVPIEMTIEELTAQMNYFVESKGWYQADSPKPQTPRNLAISIAVEAAELLEHFQWQEQSQDLEGLASELADVALYLLQLADVAGINLEQAILTKLAYNQTRQWNKS